MKIRNSIECYILIQNSNNVLLMHKPESKAHPSFFQPITGGIEEGEDAFSACIREVKEETGIILKKDEVKWIKDYNYEFDAKGRDLHVKKNLFIVFMEKEPSVTISDEHDGYKWTNLSKVPEFLYWDSNRISYKRIIAEIKH